MDWRIDVVIPAYRPDARLLSIVELLSWQSMSVRSIQVIDTGDLGIGNLLRQQGQTVEEYSAQYPSLQVTQIPMGTFDHGGTRNMGLTLCPDSDILIYMTQDAVPAGEDLVANLVQPLMDDATLEAVYARQLPYPDATIEERCSRAFNYPAQSQTKAESDFARLGIKTYFCSNVCAAYRAEILRELDGFPTQAIFNEDMIYAGRALKAGYRIRYCAEAQVYHSHSYGAMAQFHRNFDLGVSQAENPEIFAAASSEGEGVTYVKAVIGEMTRAGRWYEVPGFCWRCGWRLLGYRLGKNYKRLPRRLVVLFSSNKSYWKRPAEQ